MRFASSGSVTSCVKSNCLVTEHVHRIYIENILCVSAQFLCLCMNLLYKRKHWLSFLYPASVLLLKYTCHLNNALVLKSSSRLICAGNFGLLCSSVEREADNAQIACDC